MPLTKDDTAAPERVLLVCTANRCRSPMAEALMCRSYRALGVATTVASAGSRPGGEAASAGSVRAMARRGLDLTGHRSRQLTPGVVAAADLVLGMAPRHCRNVVVLHPPAWPRTFTLRELVRRGEGVGPRRHGQTLDEWLAVLGRGRARASLLVEHPDDEVADPIGGPDSAYEHTAALLEHLVDRVVELVFPRPRPTGR